MNNRGSLSKQGREGDGGGDSLLRMANKNRQQLAGEKTVILRVNRKGEGEGKLMRVVEPVWVESLKLARICEEGVSHSTLER